MNTVSYRLRSAMKRRKDLYDQDLGDSKEADDLMDEVTQCVLEHHADLTVEDIFEGLTSVGWCPSLIFDDDGHWAVLQEGIQSIRDQGNFQGMWMDEGEAWKPSIREAVGHFIEQSKVDRRMGGCESTL